MLVDVPASSSYARAAGGTPPPPEPTLDLWLVCVRSKAAGAPPLGGWEAANRSQEAAGCLLVIPRHSAPSSPPPRRLREFARLSSTHSTSGLEP